MRFAIREKIYLEIKIIIILCNPALEKRQSHHCLHHWKEICHNYTT